MNAPFNDVIHVAPLVEIENFSSRLYFQKFYSRCMNKRSGNFDSIVDES